jgi:hypothetical protein
VWATVAVPMDGWDHTALRREQLSDCDMGPMLREVETE